MQLFSTNQLKYNKQFNSFSACSSDLCDKNFYSIGDKIKILNPKTNKSRIFTCHKIDKDSSNEDTYGWHFKSKEGINCLIIND